MIIVDTALKARAKEGKPIRVGLLGAGFMGQGARQSDRRTACAGMRLAGDLQQATRAGRRRCTRTPARVTPVEADTQSALDQASEHGKPVVTCDALLLARSEHIDVLVDTTGSVEFGAQVILEAFKHGKDVVLLNAEIDATIGPILQVYAEKHGVILSACDGDEPGIQMNLYRWVTRPRPHPARHGKHQGPSGSVSDSRRPRRVLPRSGDRTRRW